MRLWLDVLLITSFEGSPYISITILTINGEIETEVRVRIA